MSSGQGSQPDSVASTNISSTPSQKSSGGSGGLSSRNPFSALRDLTAVKSPRSKKRRAHFGGGGERGNSPGQDEDEDVDDEFARLLNDEGDDEVSDESGGALSNSVRSRNSPSALTPVGSGRLATSTIPLFKMPPPPPPGGSTSSSYNNNNNNNGGRRSSLSTGVSVGGAVLGSKRTSFRAGLVSHTSSLGSQMTASTSGSYSVGQDDSNLRNDSLADSDHEVGGGVIGVVGHEASGNLSGFDSRASTRPGSQADPDEYDAFNFPSGGGHNNGGGGESSSPSSASSRRAARGDASFASTAESQALSGFPGHRDGAGSDRSNYSDRSRASSAGSQASSGAASPYSPAGSPSSSPSSPGTGTTGGAAQSHGGGSSGQYYREMNKHMPLGLSMITWSVLSILVPIMFLLFNHTVPLRASTVSQHLIESNKLVIVDIVEAASAMQDERRDTSFVLTFYKKNNSEMLKKWKTSLAQNRARVDKAYKHMLNTMLKSQLERQAEIIQEAETQTQKLSVVRTKVDARLLTGPESRNELLYLVEEELKLILLIAQDSRFKAVQNELVNFFMLRRVQNSIGLMRALGANFCLRDGHDEENLKMFQSMHDCFRRDMIFLETGASQQIRNAVETWETNEHFEKMMEMSTWIMSNDPKLYGQIKVPEWVETINEFLALCNKLDLNLIDGHIELLEDHALWEALKAMLAVFLCVMSASFVIRLNQREAERMLYNLRKSRHLALAVQKFVPKNQLKVMGVRSITQVHSGLQVEVAQTMLFSDIRNFTGLSEQMSNTELFNWLQDYISRMTKVTLQQRGYIEKFIGDAVFAVFPQPNNGVKGGIKMHVVTDQLNLDLVAQGKENMVRIGVGIHHGVVVAGVFGDSSRLQATMVASDVNLASRLESLTKNFGAKICASEVVVDMLSPTYRATLSIRDLGQVVVSGSTHSIKIYDIFQCDALPVKRYKSSCQAEYKKAIEAAESSEFEKAEEIFTRLCSVAHDAGVTDVAAEARAAHARDSLQALSSSPTSRRHSVSATAAAQAAAGSSSPSDQTNNEMSTTRSSRRDNNSNSEEGDEESNNNKKGTGKTRRRTLSPSQSGGERQDEKEKRKQEKRGEQEIETEESSSKKEGSNEDLLGKMFGGEKIPASVLAESKKSEGEQGEQEENEQEREEKVETKEDKTTKNDNNSSPSPNPCSSSSKKEKQNVDHHSLASNSASHDKSSSFSGRLKSGSGVMRLEKNGDVKKESSPRVLDGGKGTAAIHSASSSLFPTPTSTPAKKQSSSASSPFALVGSSSSNNTNSSTSQKRKDDSLATTSSPSSPSLNQSGDLKEEAATVAKKTKHVTNNTVPSNNNNNNNNNNNTSNNNDSQRKILSSSSSSSASVGEVTGAAMVQSRNNSQAVLLPPGRQHQHHHQQQQQQQLPLSPLKHNIHEINDVTGASSPLKSSSSPPPASSLAAVGAAGLELASNHSNKSKDKSNRSRNVLSDASSSHSQPHSQSSGKDSKEKERGGGGGGGERKISPSSPLRISPSLSSSSPSAEPHQKVAEYLQQQGLLDDEKFVKAARKKEEKGRKLKEQKQQSAGQQQQQQQQQQQKHEQEEEKREEEREKQEKQKHNNRQLAISVDPEDLRRDGESSEDDLFN